MGKFFKCYLGIVKRRVDWWSKGYITGRRTSNPVVCTGLYRVMLDQITTTEPHQFQAQMRKIDDCIRTLIANINYVRFRQYES